VPEACYLALFSLKDEPTRLSEPARRSPCHCGSRRVTLLMLAPDMLRSEGTRFRAAANPRNQKVWGSRVAERLSLNRREGAKFSRNNQARLISIACSLTLRAPNASDARVCEDLPVKVRVDGSNIVKGLCIHRVARAAHCGACCIT